MGVGSELEKLLGVNESKTTLETPLNLRYRPADRLCVISIHYADPQLCFTRLMVHFGL